MVRPERHMSQWILRSHFPIRGIRKMTNRPPVLRADFNRPYPSLSICRISFETIGIERVIEVPAMMMKTNTRIKRKTVRFLFR